MKKKIAIIVLMLLSIIIPVKAFAKEQYKTLNLEESHSFTFAKAGRIGTAESLILSYLINVPE